MTRGCDCGACGTAWACLTGGWGRHRLVAEGDSDKTPNRGRTVPEPGQSCGRGQSSPPTSAATTRLRPCAFASYSARSAAAMSCSGERMSVGVAALTPTLTVTCG